MTGAPDPSTGLSEAIGFHAPGVEWTLMLLNTGGPVVAILGATSVLATTIVLVKLWQFHATAIGDRRTPREILLLYRAGRPQEALARARGARNPVVQTLAQAIRGECRALPGARIREEVLRFGGDLLEGSRSWLRALEVIAALAPLLGLFGTVLGMIDAFRQLESAGGQVDPSVLSGGIWEALLTTAVRLAVAIPAVVALNWLERRVDRLAHEMDSFVTQIFTDDLSEDTETDDSHGRAGFPTLEAAAGR